MSTIVVIANGVRTRFITLQADQALAYESTPRQVEAACLAEPE
ncbi:MAG: hypothetical protein ABI475_03180 [Methylophilaceae bacterium]